MKKRVYTKEEIKKLKQCFFVQDIKRKSEISYDPVFKLWTIMMRYEFPELTAREIFARAGFDIGILNNKLPQRRIKEWKDNYIKFGVKYFLPDNEPYHSINKIEHKIEAKNNLREQLMTIVLQKLKEYDNR